MTCSMPTAYNEFMAYLKKSLEISASQINDIIKNFHSEMKKGLSGYESSLKMIPSFVDRPKGNERGKYIALDLGGTNFRVLAVELDGQSGSNVLAVSKYVIKKKDMTGNAIQLFDFIATCIKDFLEEHSISMQDKLDLAFTFSFPVEQTNIAAGTLLVWTKGFTASGVQGEDVVVLLNEALKRKRINNIKVAALANDTVGTLVAKSYSQPKCDVGVILGTGTNACYPEKIANIKKWRGLKKKDHMIINMEWGNFNKLSLTYYDVELDKLTPNKGRQMLEKMVSGMYLGEISRLIINDMTNRKLIFTKSTNPIFTRTPFKTEHMSLIAGDNSEKLDEVADFLKQSNIHNVTTHDRTVLKEICSFVSLRAARVSAAAMAAVVTWMDPELTKEHIIGIDGTLYERYPGFEDQLKSVFTSLFHKKANNVKLELAKDGSGKGAAIIAAVAASSEK